MDLEVVQEVAPGLGKPNTTFQQYVMPAFCTQVGPGKAGFLFDDRGRIHQLIPR